MPCPITITKFVGTISLGLLTGISYNLSTLTLPTLQYLPTASHASRTLSALKARASTSILSLSALSSLTFLTAYVVSPRRSKHPYLLWTCLLTSVGGPGLEWWFKGTTGFDFKKVGERLRGKQSKRVEEFDEEEDGIMVNGESVERDVGRERRVQGIRTGVMGLGFVMSVVGIWGDGA